ncbi:27534_t:CDS:1, partial [Gigaspora margarita]
MAKLQESRAETLVGEDENSLTESNMLVSNLQPGTSLGHPISVLIDEFNEKQADGIEEVTRTQYGESSNPMAKSNKESENSLVNTNETWMNGPVVMDHQNRIQSQFVQMQISGTNTLHIETYDSMTNLKTHCTSLPNSSYLKQLTMEIDSNTNKEFSHRDLGESNHKRSWTSLFTKLTRGPSIYSTYLVHNQITTKNSRAAIFEIRTLIHLSMNEIAVVLNKCI